MSVKTTPKARRTHKCNFCWMEIAVNETYVHHKGAPWDHSDNNGFFAIKAHNKCWELWEQHKRDWDFLFPINEPEMIKEMLGADDENSN